MLRNPRFRAVKVRTIFYSNGDFSALSKAIENESIKFSSRQCLSGIYIIKLQLGRFRYTTINPDFNVNEIIFSSLSSIFFI